MATDLESPPSPAKFEVFVESELARVRRRIRAVDAGHALLLLLIVTLAYFLGMALFDQGTDSSAILGIRIGVFGLYVLAAVFFTGQLVARLYRQINPYYAAKQLEETLPDAKNSVINWLDLKTHQLPGAIRVALGLRAAHDLKQTDPDRAVDPKTNWLLGAVLAALVLGVLVLFATRGPKQFGSLVNRAFAPFGGIGLDKRTEITLLRPAGGDVTVALNQPVYFQAQIDGRYPRLNEPGAPRVLYRYSKSDTPVALPLEEAGDGTWIATILADQVQNGFWYKVAAGDAETPEYQVQARSNPQAIKYEITYRYRPYRKLADDRITFPNHQAGLTPRLIGPRGTDVELVIRTNRKLKEGRIEVETNAGKTALACAILADDPQGLAVKIKLEQTGKFRLLFSSSDGEDNIDRMPWSIEVFEDGAPHVELTVPGKDVSLPANGTLQLAGKATDDVGLKGLTLRYKIIDGALGTVLAPKAYRQGKSFQFDNGTYPDVIDYRDFLALDSLRTAAGDAVSLKPGTVLEYWLEALDNSDYPDAAGNVGRSQPFKVTILDPTKDDKKQKEQRSQAEKKQEEHQKKQDQEQASENTERNKQEAEKNKTEAQKQKEASDQKKNDDDLARRVEETQEKLKEKLEQQKKEEQGKAGAKGAEPDKAEAKPGSNPDQKPGQAKDQQPQAPEQAGDKKDDGKNGDGQNAGTTKDKGQNQKENDPPKSGEAKGPGEQKPDSQGEAKGGDDKKNNPSAKGEPKENAGKEQPGQTKNEGQKKSEDKAGQAKNEGPKAGEAGNQAKGQDSDKSAPSAQAKDDKSNGTSQNPQGGQGQAKEGSKDQVAQQKGSGQAPPDAGKGKSAGDAGTDPGEAQAQAKGKIDDPSKAKLKEGPAPEDKQPNAHVKSSGEKNGAAGNPKDAPPNQAKDSGLAKDENGNGKGEKGQKREPTAEDLRRLKDQLAREEQADAAMQDLKRIADEAKDPELKKAAEDLLAQSDRPIPGSPPKAKEANESTGQAQGTPKESGKENPQGAEPKPGEAKEGNPKLGESAAKGDAKEDSQNAKAENKSGGKYGDTRQGGAGITDDVKPQDPNLKFAQRGGDLQLQELKKLVTPEMLKDLNMSKDDFERFLKDSEAYNNMLRRQAATNKKDTTDLRGERSLLTGQKLREITRNPNAPVDPLQSVIALPPAEFRDAQRAFTNRSIPKGP